MKRSSTSASHPTSKIRNVSKRSQFHDSMEDEKRLPEIGIVEKISLRNFMCHGALTMHFSSNVNFIIGKNGSGKSAILTAIVVGLGGKTSSTSRGTTLKTLIKEGCSSATIEIVLGNAGDNRFKQEVYGDKISVERKLHREGGSSYKIRSATGKIVSNKKEDLMHILEYLNIYVDNPLNCLNQEMSKHFLHSKNESDKYKFFMKSTQLEQMGTEYEFIRVSKAEMQQMCRQRERALPDTEKQVKEKEDRFRNLAAVQELKKKIDKLKGELVWAHVAQVEVGLKPIEREIVKSEQKLPKFDTKLKELKQQETKASAEIRKINAASEEKIKKLKELQEFKQATKTEMESLKKEMNIAESQRKRSEQQKNEYERDKRIINEKIKEIKHVSTRDMEHERREKEEKINELRTEQTRLENEQRTVSHQAEQFLYSINTCREKIFELRPAMTEAEQTRSQLNNLLRGLSQRGGNNRLKLFGGKIPEFVAKINDAWNRRKFKQKPRGPLGIDVLLKDPKYAVPVECALKNVLRAFLVDNHDDFKVLDSIKRSVFTARESSSITIFTAEFTNTIYNVEHGKAHHPTFKTVMDLISLQDPVVANCLIDMASIESVLVIPTINDALQVMQRDRLRNASRAFTMEGDEVYYDRFYSGRAGTTSRYLQADVQGQINRVKAELAEANKTYEAIKNELASISQEIKQQEKQKATHDRQLAAINKQLRTVLQNLKKIDVVEETEILDVQDLEDEVSNLTQQIMSIETLEEESKLKRAEDRNKMTVIEAKWKKCNQEHQAVRTDTDAAKDLLDNLDQDIAEKKSHRQFYEKEKIKMIDAIEELKKKLEDHKLLIERETNKAKAVWPERINTRRMPSNLENEINQINRRIQQEENFVGEQRDKIIREYHEAKTEFHLIKGRIVWLKRYVEDINYYLAKREAFYDELCKLTACRCRLMFNTLLNQRGFNGEMKFDHEKQKLYIQVQPGARASSTKDMKALSGGERSFSTVCFILTLWGEIQSPFRCLDEFDVFMDMAVRRVAMEMMVEIAVSDQKQFIFLTPLDISAMPNSDKIRVWKMQDPDRNQTHLPFEPLRNTQ